MNQLNERVFCYFHLQQNEPCEMIHCGICMQTNWGITQLVAHTEVLRLIIPGIFLSMEVLKLQSLQTESEPALSLS